MEFTFQNNAQFSALHLALEYTGNSQQNNCIISLVDCHCMLTKVDQLNNHFFSIIFCWVWVILGYQEMNELQRRLLIWNEKNVKFLLST